MVVITPTDEPGTFKVEAKLGKEVRKSQLLSFERLLRLEEEKNFRLAFDGPLAFDCLGLRRYLNRKYYLKNFN